jgi:hypothetical protein
MFNAGSESEIAEWTNLLRMNSSPESKLMDLWTKTAKTRLMFIHCESPTVTDVIDQWPRYADGKGFLLVT